MPLQTDIENSIIGIFNNYIQNPLTLPSNKGNLYELYIFLLIYDTINRISLNGANIINPNNTFVYRCSPGLVSNGRFSYITFTKNNQIYELRNGIEIIGINMYHEIDVLIFRNQQTNNNRPAKNKNEIVWAIECKNHSKISSLKGEVRKFLGAVTDLTQTNHSMAGCIHCGIGFTPIFTTPLNSLTNLSYLVFLNNYSLNPIFNLKPNSIEEQDFITKIEELYNNQL